MGMTQKSWEPKDIEFVFSSYEGYEASVLEFLKTIPYDKQNEGAWSPGLVSLFVDICATIDSVSRHILSDGKGEEDIIEVETESGELKSKKVRDLNIDDFERLWKEVIDMSSGVVVYVYATYPYCAISPYSNHRAPDGWWTIYNALKHNRLSNYKNANISGVIIALAALFLLLIRYKKEEFTGALVRRHWIVTDIVPEYVHGERQNLWYDSNLFGTHDNPSVIISRDITEIECYLGSKKFQEFLGRFNPL